MGAVGLDMKLDKIASLIENIKIKTSGKAHLLHISDSDWSVVASPDFTNIENMTTLPTINDLMIDNDKSFSIIKKDLEASDKGDYEYDAKYLIIWNKIMFGQYIIIVSTPIVEIEEPIENQIDDITRAKNSIITFSCIFCAISLFIVTWVI